MLLLNRLTATYGLPFDDGQAAFVAFPEPEALATASVERIRTLGFSHQKARAMIDLAIALAEKQRDFSLLEGMTNEAVCTSLSSLRGVGRWTAEYVLLRGLGRLDTFPGDDVGAQKNPHQLFHLEEKPSYEKVKELTSPWHPYAGFGYFHLLLGKLDKQGILSQA